MTIIQRWGTLMVKMLPYSQQALQSVGIQPGQIVSKDGINFTWPNVLSDPNAADEPNASVSQYNNFAANGQTIAITPVNNCNDSRISWGHPLQEINPVK